ncbi:hypothetical protein CEXT_687021 [Caerostris extrusa]|uniref:Uncharacterized protein n=1 Tax=Caerostris extrusa TaxID=172846 RepID=A0AAV4MD91_CAEEX|nr:hypothetical protein CEXT_687021 [Caerostris extrusa]
MSTDESLTNIGGNNQRIVSDFQQNLSQPQINVDCVWSFPRSTKKSLFTQVLPVLADQFTPFALENAQGSSSNQTVILWQ